MASGKKRRPASRQRAGLKPFLAGVGTGMLVLSAGLLAYLLLGRPPVAVTDKPAVWEPLLTTLPLHQRVHGEIKSPPFAAGEEVFENGARLYRAHCAECHGVPGQSAVLGRAMSPRAQQFFSARTQQESAAEPAGELFWKTAFGIRNSGMPAYNRTLSNTELWQLSLMLHAAGGGLPDPVKAILMEGSTAPQPTVVVP